MFEWNSTGSTAVRNWPASWDSLGVVSTLQMFPDAFSGEALGVSPDGSVAVGFQGRGDVEFPPYQVTFEACRWVHGVLFGLGQLVFGSGLLLSDQGLFLRDLQVFLLAVDLGKLVEEVGVWA